MGGSAHINFTAGGRVFGGGLLGYVRAGSIQSLIAATCFGSLYVGAGYHVQIGNDFEGHATGAGTGWLVAAGMGQRLMKTGKMMPALPVALLGLTTALYNSKKAYDWSDSYYN